MTELVTNETCNGNCVCVRESQRILLLLWQLHYGYGVVTFFSDDYNIRHIVRSSDFLPFWWFLGIFSFYIHSLWWDFCKIVPHTFRKNYSINWKIETSDKSKWRKNACSELIEEITQTQFTILLKLYMFIRCHCFVDSYLKYEV